MTSRQLGNKNEAPYNWPVLRVETPPFIVGEPVNFHLDMQNTRSTPLAVNVDYSIVNLSVGIPFTPAQSTSKVLQPGEAWDAPVTWTARASARQCVRAALSFGPASVRSDGMALMRGDGRTAFQKNFGVDPCDSESVKKLQLRMKDVKGGQRTIAKHLFNLNLELTKRRYCLDQSLTFRQGESAGGSFRAVALPPDLTPPPVAAGGEVTVALAEKMNQLAQSAADFSALNAALGATHLRMEWAGLAGEQQYVDLQYAAYRDYNRRRGEILLAVAGQLDDYLQALQDAAVTDTLFTVDEQLDVLRQLRATGFAEDSVSFLSSSGWRQDEIERRQADAIELAIATGFISITLFGNVRELSETSAAEGQRLVDRYSARRGGQSMFTLDPVDYEFDVGHGQDSRQTVKLRVKPLTLPLDWSYELSEQELTLDPGETRVVALKLLPGSASLNDATARLAVEGYIGDELIGGIEFERRTPVPLVGEIPAFRDGFEGD